MAKVITKKDVLTAIKVAAEAGAFKDYEVNDEITVTADDVIDYVDTTIAQLEAKTAKAREKAAEKKAEGDALRAKVAEILTDELQTIAEITAQIEDPDVTAAKVTARLTALVKAGEAHKDKVKTADGRTINGYAAGPAPVPAE